MLDKAMQWFFCFHVVKGILTFRKLNKMKEKD
ncbi:hypothetical protein H4V97_000467 [Flavobacterium sp. CG_23.5]|nr:hypothetical protein [Flavobacterium sp. CG_9.10]MBP2282149.1 hypothetical protein [Flavobacterium sp. CG_23.5]